jgi:NOL1/NOP2/fmu family ribosome biogenesis protein
LAVDLCAAPGGKSTHLASLLPPGALLISNEPVPTRQAALVENLRKQGYPNVVITGDRPERLSATLGGRCDLVLVDAPCSGEGMFRKEPFARQQWSERLVTACSRTQSEIAARAWEMVAPGGHLIYSTCTWERAENEEQVQKLVERGAEHIPLSLDPAWGIVESAWGNRCYPHRLQGEGFFVALLRKPGTPAGHGTATELDAMPAFAAPLLDPTHTMRTVIIEDELFAVPTAWSGLVAQLLHAARVLAPGVPVMERKGDRWRPHAALALNQRCNTRVFRSVELDQAGALAYLRGETAPLQAVPVTTPDEALLVRHRGLALGWAHAAGHRWNNGWPNAWRIRMR